jgi:TonB family protein
LVHIGLLDLGWMFLPSQKHVSRHKVSLVVVPQPKPPQPGSLRLAAQTKDRVAVRAETVRKGAPRTDKQLDSMQGQPQKPHVPPLANASGKTVPPTKDTTEASTTHPSQDKDTLSDARNSPNINLFPEKVIADAAKPKPELTGAALAAARIKEWAAEWDAHRRLRAGDTTPELQELARRFEFWFMPTTETVARNARFGIRNASIVTHLLNAAEAYVKSPMEFMRELPPYVAQMEVVIEIDHDYEGLPDRWKVIQSSGDSDFDHAALAAIRDGLDWNEKRAHISDRPVQKTEWSFEARAYRYSLLECSLNPGLTAKGRNPDDYDDGFGKTQIIRRTRLLAVVYWPSGTDGGPNPSHTSTRDGDSG